MWSLQYWEDAEGMGRKIVLICVVLNENLPEDFVDSSINNLKLLTFAKFAWLNICCLGEEISLICEMCSYSLYFAI